MEDCTLKASLGYIDMSQKQTKAGMAPYTVTPGLGRLSQEDSYELRDQAGVFLVSIGPLKDEQGLDVQNGHMSRAGESHRTKLRRDCLSRSS